jgi:hypothetical protein
MTVRCEALPAATAKDEALVRRFAEAGPDVRFLGDWPESH